MTKKRLIVSYKNLSPEVLKALKAKYPDGFSDHLIKINKSDSEFFYAVSVETEDAVYLVKVDVNLRAAATTDNDEDEDDSFPDIVPAPVAGDDVDFAEDEQDDDIEDYPDKPLDDFDDDDD